MEDDKLRLYFSLFNEIGIINQLSRTLMNASLPAGLQTTHFGVVNHLMRVGDGPTPLALAQAFQVSKTTMGHTLAGLEKNGLIDMRPNPEDGRSKQVWITEKGRLFREEALLATAPMLADLAEELPVETVGQIVEELTKIRSYLDKRRNP